MVGEVRDGETAEIALQAALTGHMVLATLHTNDASSAITRLLELGVDPFVLASTLAGVVAQRLVRTVCGSCRVETFLTQDQMTLIGLDVHAALRAPGPRSGIDGRIRRRMRRMPLDRPARTHRGLRGARNRRQDPEAHRGEIEPVEITGQQARRDGLLTPARRAIKKLAKGATSFDEVLRVTTDA